MHLVKGRERTAQGCVRCCVRRTLEVALRLHGMVPHLLSSLSSILLMLHPQYLLQLTMYSHNLSPSPRVILQSTCASICPSLHVLLSFTLYLCCLVSCSLLFVYVFIFLQSLVDHLRSFAGSVETSLVSSSFSPVCSSFASSILKVFIASLFSFGLLCLFFPLCYLFCFSKIVVQAQGKSELQLKEELVSLFKVSILPT